MKESIPHPDSSTFSQKYINALTHGYWESCNDYPESSRRYMRDLCDYIFDNDVVRTELKGFETLEHKDSYIFAPNHPTVLKEHKILFNNTHSLPYYIVYFDALMEKLTGKKVHFIVTDPNEMAQYMPALKDDIQKYQDIIKSMEYIMVPHGKMTQDQLETMNNQVQEYLNKGEHVALFPEGHWYGTGNIGPIQKGLIHLMRQNPEHPVVPVRMDGFDEPYESVSFAFGNPENSDKIPQKPLDEVVQEFRDRVFVQGLGFRPVEKR